MFLRLESSDRNCLRSMVHFRADLHAPYHSARSPTPLPRFAAPWSHKSVKSSSFVSERALCCLSRHLCLLWTLKGNSGNYEWRKREREARNRKVTTLVSFAELAQRTLLCDVCSHSRCMIRHNSPRKLFLLTSVAKPTVLSFCICTFSCWRY